MPPLQLPRTHTTPARRGRAYALGVMLLCAACSTPPTGATEEPGPTGEIVVAVQAPPPFVSGNLTLTGTLKPSKGVKVEKVVVRSGANEWPATLAGSGFSFELDTAQESGGKPVFKCGPATFSVVATGSVGTGASKAEVTGAAEVATELDNCAPLIEFLEPVDGSVHVGKVTLKVKVGEKNFKSARLEISNHAPHTIEKPGTTTFELNRGSEPTAEISLLAVAADKAGNEVEKALKVTVVKPPKFLGDATTHDAFDSDMHDVALGDLDGDGVLDAVVATGQGLVVRRGLPVADLVDDAGEPIIKGSTHFDPADDKKDATGAPTVNLDGIRIKGADMRFVRLTDVDNDGDLDALAVGLLTPDKPGVWALLNDGSGKLRLVETRELPEPALSTALADLDLDGRLDLVVGAQTPHKGLMSVLLTLDPVCTVGKVEVPCLEADVAKVTKAGIFRPGVNVTPHKGVTGIASIAVADFYADDNSAPDVCVGEKDRNVISCYRNAQKNGVFEHAQDSYIMYDAPDTTLVAAAEFSSSNGSDGPDLIVATASGIVRWLKGNHQGLFQFDPTKHRTIVGFVAKSLRIEPIGPDGALYVILVCGGRVVTVVPLALDDHSHVDMCFRSWVLGGGISEVEPGDVDNDGLLDLIGLDHAPMGLQVAEGRPGGDFNAPDVHHVCYTKVGGMFGAHEVAEFAFADFTGDKRPDLLQIGIAGEPLANCPVVDPPLPRALGWAFHLHLNNGEALLPAPRAGEFSPYAQAQMIKAGVSTTCQAPKPFGTVRALTVADFDGNGTPDIATSRDGADYTFGTPHNVAATLPCGPCFWFSDLNETDNHFGSDSPEDAPPKSPLCCKNYHVNDAKKTKPLSGYGAGAPLDRASASIWLAGAPQQPFGMAADSAPSNPTVIGPHFSLAAGRTPLDIVAADFNGDKMLDLATVMKEDGSRADPLGVFQDARVRIFQGDGKGKVKPAHQSGDTWKWIDPDTNLIAKNVEANYRIVGEDPFAIGAASFGDGGLPAIYTLNRKAGSVSSIRTKGNMVFDPALDWPTGTQPTSFVLRDVDPDAANTDFRNDVLFAAKGNIGFLKGQTDFYTSMKNLVETANEIVYVDTADCNQDGHQDLLMVDKASSSVQFFLGDGKGGFVLYAGTLPVLDGAVDVQQADLEGDGCLDLAVRSKNGTTVLPNLGCK